MISEESKRSIESLCTEVRKAVVQDFFARMDDDYFATFSPEEISTHIIMSAALDSGNPVQVRVNPRPPAEFDVVIVGFDYPSEFSILCGLLSAFGLNIIWGNVYSFSKQSNHPGASARWLSRHPSLERRGVALPPSPRKIVDVFRVITKPGESFDGAKQREFQEELQTLVRLLATASTNEARERLNRFLTERIERMNQPLGGLLSAVEIRFDNSISTDWTVMDVHSEDTFAFLYAISNALAMQGVYIHKVSIRSRGAEAADRFYIANQWGRKIEQGRDQERLRMAVAMIKQFTRFLPEAPDPGKAMRHFDQLLDKILAEGFPEQVMEFLARQEGMNMLAHLLGSSDFLWDDFLSAHFVEALPLLLQPPAIAGIESLRRELRDLTFEEKKQRFNRFKDDKVFQIEVRRLLASDAAILEFSQELTDLAEVVVGEAVRICGERLGGTSSPFAVFGLGKFGGREMGYASDLELLFVHEGPSAFFESLVKEVLSFIEARSKGIFHIDLRLRPHGDKGPMSSALEQFAKYYSPNGPAAPFERQALIKLRCVAGDESLGRRVEEIRDRFAYSDVPWDWENAFHMRQRQMRELVKPGETNVKYSAGGIVDIEYAVQYLQLLNGRERLELRVPNTLQAMERLRGLQIIREDDYRMLHRAYLFLRELIDALRIVRGDASDLVLPEEKSDEFKSLARRLGYREQDRRQAALRLVSDVRETMKRVNEYFVMRFSAGRN